MEPSLLKERQEVWQRISFDAAGVRGGERGGAGKPLERKDPDKAESRDRSRMVEGEVTFSGVS